MRVVVDARTVYSRHRRGTGKTLVDLYDRLAAARPTWHFLMLRQVETGPSPFERHTNVTVKTIDIRGDAANLWQDVRLPYECLLRRADVVHCPANTAPCYLVQPTVLTIHDLIPAELEPDSPETRKWLRRVRRSALRAKVVLTPSEYSRNAIVRELQIAADRVVVVPWAADSTLTRIADLSELAAVSRKYGVPSGMSYVLAFGAVDPRKNTDRIVAAWRHVPLGLRRGTVLLVVGVQDDALTELRRRWASGAADVIVQGYAQQSDLAALMSGCRVVCYPSMSEGFGLPILDAFRCGAPVITSRVTSMPEIAGECAVLVDPTSTAEIADALSSVLRDAALAARLTALGLAREQDFDWIRTAEKTAAALERAAR